MCAAVVALCGVVLRGVDGDLLNGIRGGVGRAWPIAPYTDVLVWMVPPAPKFSPVLSTKRFSPTWLVELPLKMLFVLIPFNEKLLLVSRFPLAKMA